ncbi:hypothetical protein [Mesorhizobium humile]|uniref:Uncharacterized protein n=1 Tax=Mesorhizobium humile TaxID=3072313 RepID=A0ABU4YR67_9HYPH|nr:MULTISPECIES: hypothetical protein [unclassified Mesorhizobium]MDX8463247.1 hypothetical protein [Mesorhizobium sp. VK2D]MDX8488409.1 hypothetical protein [Mesorhizobium sp. VK2B]
MRWNLAAKLSRRDLEEMAERGIAVDQQPIARAMVAPRRANSGMKDFHRMWILSRSFSFDDAGAMRYDTDNVATSATRSISSTRTMSAFWTPQMRPARSSPSPAAMGLN